MDLFMDGAPLGDTNILGVGPLAIGDIKYKTESGLFKQMLESDKALSLDFRHAYIKAKELTGLADRRLDPLSPHAGRGLG